MSRPRTIAIGALAALLVAAPFVPRGGDVDGSAVPAGTQQYDASSATAGLGSLTPALRTKIDRTVSAGLSTRVSGKQTPEALVAALVRCVELEGQRYCLGSGWTDSTQFEVRARLATAARTQVAARGGGTETTGDLDALATLRRTATLTTTERAEAERAELRMAARSVAKVWLLRHQIEGVPLPDGFLDRHPEVRTAAPVASVSGRTRTAADYPRHAKILDPKKTADQTRTYWCGPAAMEMIAWNWQNNHKSQDHWADRLGTTSDGTAISQMVRVINESTGWDRAAYAGPYITLDISNYGYGKWMTLNMRHIVDYRAPVVLHPVLLKKYYPYLDDDASGHFQAGRGYNQRAGRPKMISYFEPWNQQRFDPSEPYISRVQWRRAYKSYRANQDHFQRNIGV